VRVVRSDAISFFDILEVLPLGVRIGFCQRSPRPRAPIRRDARGGGSKEW